MYNVVDQVGARDLWMQGITGAGVTVAVIDSGVADVASLGGDKVTAVVDLSSEAGDPSTQFLDTNGHGTMMSGIIAGFEPGANPLTSADHPEKFLGVAPDANIVSVKIAGRDGSSDPMDVVAGVDWAIANADALGIKVINLSYSSGSSLSYVDDPLTAALQRAWNAGIAVVTIAGNEGNETTQLTSPGTAPFVITVAGADADENGLSIAEFSNGGDGVRNPDVSAPGAHIQSLRADGSDASDNHDDLGGVEGDPMLFTGTGTSQSAAVTSGILALLYQQNPDMTPDQAKALLMATAQPIPGSDSNAGANLVRADLAAAAPVPDATQNWTPATGSGPIDVSAIVACTASDAETPPTWVEHRLVEPSLGGASLGGASLGGASLGGASLGGASLGGASLGGASLGGASLGGASLGWSTLGGAHSVEHTRWSIARWSTLGGASLRWSIARWSTLGWSLARWSHRSVEHRSGWSTPRWSTPRWSTPRWSTLGGASLGGASLGGASLGGASLGGAPSVEHTSVEHTSVEHPRWSIPRRSTPRVERIPRWSTPRWSLTSVEHPRRSTPRWSTPSAEHPSVEHTSVEHSLGGASPRRSTLGGAHLG